MHVLLTGRRGLRRWPGFILCSVYLFPLWSGALLSSAATILYTTGFESSEGYDAKAELAGQNGWVSYGANSGGNGLVTNFMGTQAAYVGRTPVAPPADFLNVWQPVNYAPRQDQRLRLTFSTLLSIKDSANSNYDDFYWSVYNISGRRLFTIDFDNYDFGIYYVLDGPNADFSPSGLSFSNDLPYNLVVNMDFGANKWDASLSGQLLATNQPLTTTGATLNLGDVDAVWAVYDTNAPGDNYMVFDNYTVSTSPISAPPASISLLGFGQQGQALLQVSGASGLRYAVEASTNLVDWLSIKTNVISDSNFDFIDTSAAQFTRRFYRARQAN